MPLGGGSFTLQNKVLPGAYHNFVSAKNAATAGSRGVASLPLVLNWGADETIIRIDAGDFYRDALNVFGYYADAEELFLIREALKRANTLLCYKVNQGGAKATATVGGLTATAKYTGTRGNDLLVAVVENPDGGFDVVTYLDREEIERQTVATADDVKSNDFIDFEKSDDLTAAVGTELTGGTNGEASGANYTKYLATIEAEEFNVLGYPGDDSDTRALFIAFVKRLRDDEGYKITGVISGSAADHEGIINVKNGVVLEDGRTVTPVEAVAWVTGATAGAEINESLTNTIYDGAVDAYPKYTKGQYEAAVKAGEFCFYSEAGKARVVTDINSLTTFTSAKNSDWTSNRLVRVIDAWSNDSARIFGESYLGVETNDDIGRQLYKADLVSLGNQYQEIRALQNFSAYDIEIKQGNGKRDVYVVAAIQPTDAMEKLYMVTHVA